MNDQPPSPSPEFIVLGSDGRHYYADLKTFRQWVSLGSITTATQIYSQSLGRWLWAGELSAFRNPTRQVDAVDEAVGAGYLIRGSDGKSYVGDLTALRQWAAEGRISADTQVYLRGADEWVPAGRIARLEGTFVTSAIANNATITDTGRSGTSGSRAAVIVLSLVLLVVALVTVLTRRDVAIGSSPSSHSVRTTQPSGDVSDDVRRTAAGLFSSRFANSQLAGWQIRGRASGLDCGVLLVIIDVNMEDEMITALHYGSGIYGKVLPGGVANFYLERTFRGVTYRDAAGRIWVYGGVTKSEAASLSPC